MGVKINVFGAFDFFPFTKSSAKSCNIGIANAAVFPVPVCAHPKTSYNEKMF
ncbi:MAG TPA: hypothetical protein PLT17_05540 [Chitinophagales bacterium]|nr:hypothetical protein [Chitinophagales bacterium]